MDKLTIADFKAMMNKALKILKHVKKNSPSWMP